jgi:hypothetical protein
MTMNTYVCAEVLMIHDAVSNVVAARSSDTDDGRGDHLVGRSGLASLVVVCMLEVC